MAARTRFALVLLSLGVSSCGDREFLAEFSSAPQKELFVQHVERRHIAYRVDKGGRILCERPTAEQCKALYHEIMGQFSP